MSTEMDVRGMLILGFLRRREMHAYDLVKFLEQRMSFLIDLKSPTTYNLLDRLKRQGYVGSHVEREGNRPERRTYRITSKGQARFLDMLRENLSTFSSARYPDEIGFYFMDELPTPEVRGALKTKLASVRSQIADFRDRAQRHAETPARWLFDHHLAQLEAEGAWLARALRQISRRTRQQARRENGR